MTTETKTVLFQGEALTLERAEDLARRGWQPIELDEWEPHPDYPGCIRSARRRTPREVLADLDALLGEYPEGGEEGLHVTPWVDSACANCPTESNGIQRCYKYDSWSANQRRSVFDGHGTNGNGRCNMHPKCTGFLSRSAAPWPKGRLAVWSARGGSEGDYTHVDVISEDGRTETILMAKTFQGRDAAWKFARRLADLLGV
jgi:hypothetical protein